MVAYRLFSENRDGKEIHFFRWKMDGNCSGTKYPFLAKLYWANIRSLLALGLKAKGMNAT